MNVAYFFLSVTKQNKVKVGTTVGRGNGKTEIVVLLASSWL